MAQFPEVERWLYEWGLEYHKLLWTEIFTETAQNFEG